MQKIDLEEIKKIFSKGGLLDGSIPFFEIREGQAEIAIEVAKVINSDLIKHSRDDYEGTYNQLIVEAGTGMGKTYTYLIPILKAINDSSSSPRFLISTFTKALQDQILLDLPLVSNLINKDVFCFVLKGRGNYLCTKRLVDAANNYLSNSELTGLDPSQMKKDLNNIIQFYKKNSVGEIYDIPGVKPDSPVWSLVTSNSHNCKDQCTKHKKCFYHNAMKSARSADILIVNNALLISHLKSNSKDKLATNYHYVVFDEAHSLIENIHEYFADNMDLNLMNGYFSDIHSRYNKYKSIKKEFKDEIKRFSKIKNDLINSIDKDNVLRSIQLRDDESFSYEYKNLEGYFELLLSMIPINTTMILSAAGENSELKEINELNTEFEKFLEEYSGFLNCWFNAKKNVHISWINHSDENTIFYFVPINAGLLLKELILNEFSTMFFSSTLRYKNKFDQSNKILNLDNPIEVYKESPFDYHNNSLLFIPKNIPDMRTRDSKVIKEYKQYILSLIIELIITSNGGVLVLFSTHDMLNSIGRKVAAELANDYDFIFQGENDPIGRFTSRYGKPNILMGTKTFWQGVNIPGLELRLVIIDKIPFTPVYDPVYVTLKEYEREMVTIDGNEQNEFQIFDKLGVYPAAIQMKQGAGRLIRQKNDKGVVVIVDPAFDLKNSYEMNKYYAQNIIDSLQPMKLTRDINNVKKFYKEIN